jgi:hypothetical protein
VDGGYTHILLCSAELRSSTLSGKGFEHQTLSRSQASPVCYCSLDRRFARWGVAIPEDAELEWSMVALVVWWMGSVFFASESERFRLSYFPFALF